jgi:hypothetical protein
LSLVDVRSRYTDIRSSLQREVTVRYPERRSYRGRFQIEVHGYGVVRERDQFSSNDRRCPGVEDVSLLRTGEVLSFKTLEVILLEVVV